MSNLLDHFTDTNGTAIGSHTMDTGPGWTAFGAGGSTTIQSNKLAITANSAGCYVDPGVADGTYQITANLHANSNFELFFNDDEIANAWTIKGATTEGLWHLGNVIAGVPTANVVSASSVNPPAASGSQTYQVILAGDNLKFKVDGTTVFDYTGSPRPLKALTIFGVEHVSDLLTTWDEFSFTAAASAPDTPTGLAPGTVTSTTVPLTWNAVSGATGYLVYFDTDSGFANGYDPIDTATAMTTAMALNAGTLYYFKVSAYNGTGESAASSAITAETASALATPGARRLQLGSSRSGVRFGSTVGSRSGVQL
jgi:hypothetical protein